MDRVPTEILIEIFTSVGQHIGKTLTTASLVCRFWSDIALDLLWRGDLVRSPPICVLHAMYNKRSIEKYFSKIRHLSIYCNYCRQCRTVVFTRYLVPQPTYVSDARRHRAFFRGIKLSKRTTIESLTLMPLMKSETSHADLLMEVAPQLIPEFIPPKIRCLVFHHSSDFDFKIDLFLSVLVHCQKLAPPLEEFHLRCPVLGLPTRHGMIEGQFEFFQQMRSLRIIRISGAESSLATLALLARSQTLREIRFVVPAAVNFAGRLPERSFARVTKLKMAQLQETGPLMEFPSGLRSLDLLFIPDRHHTDVLCSIAKLSQLQDLRITAVKGLSSDGNLDVQIFSTSKMLEVFANCRNLRDIRIVIGYESFLLDRRQILHTLYMLHHTSTRHTKNLRMRRFRFESTRVSSAQFYDLLTAAPATIERLELPIYRECGREEIKALALGPPLREIGIMGKFQMDDIREWRDPPSLPSLEYIIWHDKYPKSTFKRPLRLTQEELFFLRPIFPNLNFRRQYISH